MGPVSTLESHVLGLLAQDGREPAERARLATLMCLLADLPPPPDPVGLFPRYAELREDFLEAACGDLFEPLEEAFLALYAHLHGFEAPYTAGERAVVDGTGGYWSHAGGLAPILKAGPHIRASTVSGDLGAGNGLQALLIQRLHPHARTIQVEISSRMIEAGRHLQSWLGIPADRVEWIAGDVLENIPRGMGFVYLYRPVRPEGRGRLFYERLARTLEGSPDPVVVFSIADCLREFLPTTFEVFYTDGHLTCMRGPWPQETGSRPSSPKTEA